VKAVDGTFAIIGGGLVGLGLALAYLRSFPGAPLVLVEKESDVARHQSGNNSEVLHAGLYCLPGSARVLMSVAGLREMLGVLPSPHSPARAAR
jgi:(S)-2-hydroxyglutarate dehydrogenase